jgi:chaperonin GroES
MQIKPLGKRILVEPVEAESKTASGIIIPDSAKEKQQKATVVAISKELTDDEKNELKIGQTVLFGKYSGTEIEIDKKQYLMLKTEDVLAIL